MCIDRKTGRNCKLFFWFTFLLISERVTAMFENSDKKESRKGVLEQGDYVFSCLDKTINMTSTMIWLLLRLNIQIKMNPKMMSCTGRFWIVLFKQDFQNMKSTCFSYLRFRHRDKKKLSTNLHTVISFFLLRKNFKIWQARWFAYIYVQTFRYEKNPKDEFLLRVTLFFLLRKDLKNDKHDDLVTCTIGCSNKKNPKNENVNILILILIFYYRQDSKIWNARWFGNFYV